MCIRDRYTADYGAIDAEIVSVPLVGGYCNNGLRCGAYVSLNNTAGDAGWHIAPGLSCIMPNTCLLYTSQQERAQEKGMG